jgi:hypothetical protein
MRSVRSTTLDEDEEDVQAGGSVEGPVWLQVASLVVVLLALAVSTYQVWLARRQTVALQRTTEAALTAGQAEARHQVLYADPELLAWHLRNRNCEGANPFENKQRYFIIQKLLSNEALYVGNRQGFISDATWAAWLEVVKADALVPEARAIWPATRYLYAEEFAVYVDSLIADHAATEAQAATGAVAGD